MPRINTDNTGRAEDKETYPRGSLHKLSDYRPLFFIFRNHLIEPFVGALPAEEVQQEEHEDNDSFEKPVNDEYIDQNTIPGWKTQPADQRGWTRIF